MVRIALLLAAAGFAAGCTTVPTVTKQKMTLGEAHIEGMECRPDIPLGTNMPRTICASKAAWAKFDADERYESELAFQKARSGANAGPFNRQ